MNEQPCEHDDALPPEPTPALPPEVPLELPAELVDALRELDGPAVLPSAAHDEALLAGAREYLAGMPELPGVGISQVERRGRSRYVLAFVGAGGALAAAAAVTFAVIVGQGGHEQATSPNIAQNESDSRRPTDAGLSARPDADIAPDAGRPPAARQPENDAVAGDLDRSGTLDILDAFALARAIERSDGDPLPASNDFNGDGRVDPQDADWLARRAVAITHDGGQG